jgi:hypothetical protein
LVQNSSVSAATALLQGFSSSSGVGSLSNSSSPSVSLLNLDETAHLDAELKVLLKRLTKKGSITRQKALDELLSYLQNADLDVLKDFLPFWVYFYLFFIKCNNIDFYTLDSRNFLTDLLSM